MLTQVCYRLIMAVILSRDHSLTVLLLSTYGKASLLSMDGREVEVPLAPLLGASSLVRSIVASSHLHPGIHGPLFLSFEVTADILACVGEIFGTGESILKGGNIEDVKHVFDVLGVEANLSQSRTNIETHEQEIAFNEENVKLEIVFDQKSDNDTDIIDADADDKEVHDGSYEQSYDNVEKCQERPENVQKSNNCEYSAMTASDLKEHKESHTGSNRSGLENHNIDKTRKESYTCQICASSFYDQSSLRKHWRIHTGEKPHTCKICDKSFSQACHLREHNKTHTREKPYTCQVCEKSFSQASNLRMHNKIHTGEKPHTCKICNKFFIQAGNLRSHYKIHTGEKPF